MHANVAEAGSISIAFGRRLDSNRLGETKVTSRGLGEGNAKEVIDTILGVGETCDRALLDTDDGLLAGVVRKGGKEAIWQAQHSHPLSHDCLSRRKHEQKKKLILSVSTLSVSTLSCCAFASFD